MRFIILSLSINSYLLQGIIPLQYRTTIEKRTNRFMSWHIVSLHKAVAKIFVKIQYYLPKYKITI